ARESVAVVKSGGKRQEAIGEKVSGRVAFGPTALSYVWVRGSGTRHGRSSFPTCRLPLAACLFLCLLVAGAGRPAPAQAAAQDLVADRVLGQAGFGTGNAGAISASALRSPAGVAFDSAGGRLYVADTGNHRVLSWPSAAGFANGAAADLVLGQST